MFFVVNMQKLTNTTAQVVNRYNTEDDARSNYHSVIASNYTAKEAGSLEGFAVTLLEQHGRYVDSESVGMD